MKPASPEPSLAEWDEYTNGNEERIPLGLRRRRMAEGTEPSIALVYKVSAPI